MSKIELLTDEEGAARTGMSREGHEGMVHVHVYDSTQKVPAFYDSPVIVRRVEQELRASHYLIGVVAKREPRLCSYSPFQQGAQELNRAYTPSRVVAARC